MRYVVRESQTLQCDLTSAKTSSESIFRCPIIVHCFTTLSPSGTSACIVLILPSPFVSLPVLLHTRASFFFPFCPASSSCPVLTHCPLKFSLLFRLCCSFLSCSFTVSALPILSLCYGPIQSLCSGPCAISRSSCTVRSKRSTLRHSYQTKTLQTHPCRFFSKEYTK